MIINHLFINGDSRKMSLIPNESVQLIVTSPPYWQLKDYGIDRQIGFNDTYEEYINNLNLVWSECFRVLESGCRLCINIGDQFARSVYYGRYKVIPIHSEIIRFCEEIGFDYMGSIIWQKPTSMHTTGGQMVMGSFPYPRGGIVKIDFEQILLFKKLGKAKSVAKVIREDSKLSAEEWNEYFSSHWTFKGARQDKHIAVFPEELPKRLIKMFSYVGDTVLDPFMGSGTTALAAGKLGRNSIGYEINNDFRIFYKEKVIDGNLDKQCLYSFAQDTSIIDIQPAISVLPYRFVDVHKIDKQIDLKSHTYGSKFEMDDKAKNEIKNNPDVKILPTGNVPTVLINHARSSLKKLMIEKGICYLRAGDSKGSVLVTPGFERMQYILLHTNGEDAHLFKLRNKGSFKIWTKENLEQIGFSPAHAAYYVVLQFDNSKEFRIRADLKINEGYNTFKARIVEFDEIK